ncbi:transglycosylase domain-containing protein [Alkalibacillus almallahensis]|uniref:transglycosylase domain-containing protein n=1 Tax=Alkalibacillus almallahensis TaxID=1379154 RepID=UPI00141DA4C7|nr:PBP1A family penicillin-binding protein [Alkalibacillus almallahensis]NIK12643.1 penicillin-binding protein 2A [Alkalibacillus almallahensis]
MAVINKLNQFLGKWRYLVYSVVVLVLLSLIGYLAIVLGGRFVVDEEHFVFDESTVLTTENGEDIIKLYDENRTYVPLDTMPDHVTEAFLAIEDHRFYDHNGVDFWAVGRAVWRDIATMSKAEGASTITQQLVKNVSLTNDQTWMRKTKEVMGAIYLERQRTKDEILEYYLNEIYFGNGIHGIEEAAQAFYSKSVSELTLSEGATLAAMPKAPNYYDPSEHPERVEERRDIVLSQMENHGMLQAEEMRQAQGRTLGLDLGDTESKPATNSYVDLVLDELEHDYHLSRDEIYTGGYEITVGLDPSMQETVHSRMQQEDYFQGSTDQVEGATVLVDQTNAVIRAAVGGRDREQGDLNRVQVRRQPGSTFKPLAVYGPALEESLYHPYSLIPDEQRDYDGYSPENVDGQYAGEVTIYDALVQSKNAPAVALLDELGISQGLSYLEDIGYSIENNGLSVALGGLEEGLTPIELAGLYRSFANEGRYIEPYNILEVKNRYGEIMESPDRNSQQLFSPQTSWNLTRMLEAVVEDGTASGGQFNKDLAGKTGSTQHPHVSGGVKDAWFVGFNPDYAVASWIGYDVSNEENYLTAGSQLAVSLVDGVMSDLDQSHNLTASFTVPEGVDDLEGPIRLPQIDDLEASVSLGFLSGVDVQLIWTHNDDRVRFDVYRVTGDQVEKIGSVTGENTYQVNDTQMFNNPSYYVVPVNPLNGSEGEPSNRDQAF